MADRIVEIARAWIGTPYVHQASLKGVGCDCLGLIRGIWRELYGEEPEDVPPYSMDWAEATGAETLYMALSRHARSIPPSEIAPGDIALFRMLPRGPAKHCGIVASRESTSLFVGRSANAECVSRVGGDFDAGAPVKTIPRPKFAPPHRVRGHEFRPPHSGGGEFLTLIHSRQNKRVSEEPFSAFWRGKLAFAFRL